MIWLPEDGIPPKKARRKRRSQPEVDSEEEEVGYEEARRLALLRLGRALRKSDTALGRSSLRDEPEEDAPPQGGTVSVRCEYGHVEDILIQSYEVFYAAVSGKLPALVHQVDQDCHADHLRCPECGAYRHPRYIVDAAGPPSGG